VSGLEVAGIVVRAGAVTVLDGAAFSSPAGSVTALLGPNGAGKSTLLRVIAGVERPHAGEVRFEGDDVARLPRRARARRVALLEQDATTELPLTGRAVVGLGRTPHETVLGGRDPGAAAAVDRALRAAGATAFADRELPTLSGGERQRVLLARALAQEPRLLLLDEPTNHLDVGARLEVFDLLRELAASGVTVVAALHDLALAASHVDRVAVLAHGRVVASGPTADVLTSGLVREVYGVAAAWTTNPVDGRPLLALGTSPATT
jgi:iron complex transport system ATP-binding protein